MTAGITPLYQAFSDFDVMRRQCEISKKGLKAELDNLEATMDKELAGLDEHEQDAFFGNINDYWIETAETLPRLQWYAQLLVVFGYFENLINEVCRGIRADRGYLLSLNDLHGQGITRAKNYLVKVAGIERPFTGRPWQIIKLVAEVRNAVAHREGYVDHVPDDAQSAYSRLSRLLNVELVQEVMNQPDAQIVFGHELLLSVLETLEKFTRDLANELTGVRMINADPPEI